jgi:hypothetical protein
MRGCGEDEDVGAISSPIFEMTGQRGPGSED